MTRGPLLSEELYVAVTPEITPNMPERPWRLVTEVLAALREAHEDPGLPRTVTRQLAVRHRRRAGRLLATLTDFEVSRVRRQLGTETSSAGFQR